MQKREHKITELENPEYHEILDRAEQRIKEAIDDALVSDQTTGRLGPEMRKKDEIEILSFPIAVMMVISANDSSLKRRYALAEAKRAYNLLKQENQQKLIAVAQIFNLKIKHAETYVENLKATTSGFYLDFTSYLKNTNIFHESKWKLVNRTILHGEVHLTSDETARLIAEEVRAYVEKKLDLKMDFVLSPAVANRVEKLKQSYVSLRKKIHEEEMPKETTIAAFPPCIRRLYDTALSKGHLSHIERFTLTAFLLNCGMTVENVIECFRPTSDFSEKMTRYQVEHIAGRRGSGTKYVPPKCDTLRTHGVCPGADEICEKAWRPLTYYRRKLKIIRPQTPVQ